MKVYTNRNFFCLFETCGQVALSKRLILASRCVWLAIGRSLWSTNINLMWRQRPSGCHVASVVITESNFHEFRYELSGQHTVSCTTSSWSLTVPRFVPTCMPHFVNFPTIFMKFITVYAHKNALRGCELGENLGGNCHTLLPGLR